MVWEDAPSHVCRGGDKRALTFCCPPIKPCPIVMALDDAGLTPQKYIEIKEDFGRRTKLGEGAGTCFGSLVWCCKPSKPCPLRDMALRRINMSTDEFLTLKKQLSEELVGSFGPNDEEIKSLAASFNIGIEEAKTVLNDCHNDMRTAIKVLRMKHINDE